MLATNVDEAHADKILVQTIFDVKLSILMIKSKLNKDAAEKLLMENSGYMKKAL
ncbi:hypothetical protein G9F72_021020 [Clostridium estertheticum]|uniref:hypothetical protein n=1 Tax=Clostridium estertheticum TaxID=238834 RepID=UPI0013E937D9|nr:hypothetical protein [Clostridium estertheticum]MBZ9688806.1 hypothetical protein [Clostridium estertheticum]